ncbi:MAG: Fe-S oxidoreductase, partial [Ekhidna sp.]
MEYIPQIVFVLIAGFFGFLIYRRISQISKNIKLGKDVDLSGNKAERLRTMLLVAFGQKKMFKRPIPAFLHLLIYVGFILINIEVLEIVIDGVFGTHRVAAPVLGGLYVGMINFFELLAVGVLFSCVVFLIRRNILRINRFKKIEMVGWPSLDANLILIIEILLMVAILGMNGADQILQERGADHYTQVGSFFFSSSMFGWLFQFETGTLIFVERA